ncbi:UNVERIFIED_CONTAM: hypothetical protein GTU68_002894 [Idotea baltica]|nr:hypothetical protein [Idotea baltica]
MKIFGQKMLSIKVTVVLIVLKQVGLQLVRVVVVM